MSSFELLAEVASARDAMGGGCGSAKALGLAEGNAVPGTGLEVEGCGGGGATGRSPAASAGSWALAGKASGGLEKFRISTSWLAPASARSTTRQPPDPSLTTVPTGSPAGNRPPSPELVTWSPVCSVTVCDTISSVGIRLLSPAMI